MRAISSRLCRLARETVVPAISTGEAIVAVGHPDNPYVADAHVADRHLYAGRPLAALVQRLGALVAAPAALAVSLCVGAGSAALAPLALLGGFVQRALAGAEFQHVAEDGDAAAGEGALLAQGRADGQARRGAGGVGLGRAGQVAQQAQAAAAAPLVLRQRNGRRPHLLLAEDCDPVRIVTAAMLKAMGCDVDAVVHGEEAVRQAEEQSFDVIVLDIEMPIKSPGWAVSKATTRFVERDFPSPSCSLMRDSSRCSISPLSAAAIVTSPP